MLLRVYSIVAMVSVRLLLNKHYIFSPYRSILNRNINSVYVVCAILIIEYPKFVQFLSVCRDRFERSLNTSITLRTRDHLSVRFSNHKNKDNRVTQLFVCNSALHEWHRFLTTSCLFFPVVITDRDDGRQRWPQPKRRRWLYKRNIELILCWLASSSM